MNDQKGTQAAGNKGTPEKNQVKELSKEEMEKVQGGDGIVDTTWLLSPWEATRNKGCLISR